MREIKFRGFHEYINGKTVITVKGKKKRGTWFYGSYCPYTWGFAGRRINEPQIIIHDENNENDGLWVEVVPETVGQFTGLHDKNGKEIYEGDVVESRASENEQDWKKWVCVYQDGSFCFEAEVGKRKKKIEQNLLCEDEINLYGLEVIGNIYDKEEINNG